MQSNRFLQSCRKWCILLARSALILLIACILISVVFWGVLQLYGGKWVREQLEPLQASTGLNISIGNIDVTFLPWPALAFSDLRIENSDFELFLPWSFARPNFFELLLGRFRPVELTFLRPYLTVRCDLGRLDFNSGDSLKSQKKGFDWRRLFASDCRFRFSQLDIRVHDKGGAGLYVGNLSTDITLSQPETLSGYAQIGRIGLRDAAGRRFVLRHPVIEGQLDLGDLLSSANTLSVGCGLNLADVLKEATLELKYSPGAETPVKLALNGDLVLDHWPEPLAIEADINFNLAERKADVSRLDWILGADSGRLKFLAELPEDLEAFSIKGTFTANRLSLTQWLGFARNLAPGLQLSLDNIFDAFLDFRLDAKSLEVPQLSATCNGSKFTGKGGVADFSAPVVFLDLETDKTNLGLGLEESVAVSPQAPWFPFQPFTPMPGEPLREGETGVGYDVNIGAKILDYGPLAIKNAKLRIYPGKMDKDGLEETLLAGQADFYGGKLKGECVLGAPVWLPITITGQASNVNGKLLARDLPAWPFTSGNFNSSAAVKSQGKDLAVFLKNLRGNVKVEGSKPAFTSGFTLEKLEAQCTLKGGASDGKSAFFDGDWTLVGGAADFTANASLTGRLVFGKTGTGFNNLRWQACAEMKRGTLSGLKIQGTGAATWQLDKDELAISGAVLETDALTMGADVNFNYKKLTVKGKLVSKKLETSKLLAKLGFPGAVLPAGMRPDFVETEFRYDTDSLQFEKLNARSGQDALKGSLEWNLASQRPVFKFNLAVNRFVIAASKPSSRPWDFSFLKTFDANGVLTLQKLEGWEAELANIRLPLNLQNGVLNFTGATAKFYDGPVRLSGQANFNNEMCLDVKADVKDVNLDELVRKRKLDIKITGMGSLKANLRSSGNRSERLMAELGGDCEISAHNGSWQTIDKGKLKGKPTLFNKFSASAKILKGRFDTNDLVLSGPDLHIDGKGYLNLVKRDLDYTLNVNMKGVPDFPLYIYGPFDKPKTRVGAGRLVLNALGSVVQGFGNILGGIGEGFAKLFK